MLTDWLNEERLEHAHTFCFHVHAALSVCLSVSLSLSDHWNDNEVKITSYGYLCHSFYESNARNLHTFSVAHSMVIEQRILDTNAEKQLS